MKAPKTSGGCTPRNLSIRQAAETTTALAEGESDLSSTAHDHSAVATGSEGVPDQAVSLHELISTQEQDLRTAALIGQRLVDANDELSAQLEVTP